MNEAQAPESVTRYVVTHVGENGQRVLCAPAQGRFTKATEAEATELLANMMKNNRIEANGKLGGVFGLSLEVRPVACYPGHFDPMRVIFD